MLSTQRIILTLSIPLLACACMCARAQAGNVERLIKKDGSTVAGEVLGFENGKYAVRVGDTVVQVPANEVRTIDATPTAALPPPDDPQGGEVLGVEEVLEVLHRRPEARVTAKSVQSMNDASAAVLRGEWEVASRILGGLLASEPDWSDPHILAGILHMERSENEKALRVALRMEMKFPKDDLALRAAASIYRRLGFIDRAAETLEKVFRAGLTGDRIDYELAHLWWYVDAARASEHWQRYLAQDPGLRRPFCREGELLRKAELALTSEDWYSAQNAADEVVRKYPWVAAETARIRRGILESRLRAAEMTGDIDVALVSAESLAKLDAGHHDDWLSRLQSLRVFHLQQGTLARTVAEYSDWCVQSAHLFAGGEEEMNRIACQFQTLAAAAVQAGDLESAEAGFHEAARYSPGARPAGWREVVDSCFLRARQEVEVGREARAIKIAALLRDAYPERCQEMADRVKEQFGGEFSGQDALALAGAIEEVRSTLLASPAQPETRETAPQHKEAGAGSGIAEATPAEMSAEVKQRAFAIAYPFLQKYFPHTLGSRWVYKRGDGIREVRRVTSLTPEEDGGVRFSVEVSDEGELARSGGATNYFVVGADLLSMSRTAPPGEYALRYPFTDGVRWSWQREGFQFERKVRRPSEPLHTPIGSFSDYFVVEAENSFVSPGAEPVRVKARLYYAAKIGLVKVECDDPSISRVLVEYTGGGAPGSAATTGPAKSAFQGAARPEHK